MSDLVKRLKDRANRKWTDEACRSASLFSEAADLIESLRQQLAECERERDELVAAMKDAYPYEKHLADGCDCPWCKALAKVGSDKGGV